MHNGEFYPSEIVVHSSQQYVQTLKVYENLMQQLSRCLSKEDYTMVEELQTQSQIAQCEENECHFKYGFSAGLLRQEAVKQVKHV